MQDTTKFYRYALSQLLESKAHYNEGQVTSIVERFDSLKAAGTSDETAFEIVHESFGNSETQKEIRTIKELLEKELGQFNKNSKGVETNPVLNLRSWVKRFNDNLDKCAIEVNGTTLSKQEVDRIRPQIPKCMAQETYTATAKVKGKAANLILEVTNIT